MKKFLVLYNAPISVMEKWTKSSKEDQKKGMDEWNAWGEKHKNDLVEFGNPVGKNKRVTTDDAIMASILYAWYRWYYCRYDRSSN